MFALRSVHPNKKLGLQLSLSVMVLGVTVWFVFARFEQARTLTYTIPPGTKQLLAEGQELVGLPDEVIFTIGVQDTIVIENQDDAVHSFGPFTILPRTTLVKRFEKARTYTNLCTFHKDRQLKLVVEPAPWAFLQ